MSNETEIVFEKWPFWIRRATEFKGFEVYRCSSTHSVRVARIIGYEGEVGLAKAKAEIDRRRVAEQL